MPEVVDPLDIIEARVKKLEMKVFGENVNNFDVSTISVVDMLSKSQTLITTAISSQEKINKIVKRLDQLELVLDPAYEDTLVDNTAKIEMILLMENEVCETLKQLKSLKEMNNILESEQIRNIPKVEDRLSDLVKLLLQNKEKTEKVTKNVNNLLKHYNDVINNFTKTFAQLNEIITELEIEAQPKKVVE
ncbi:dynactin 3, p24 subunit [Lycorma delicatula]|uniref:dynactin 3, p24 subunit n=1 Tax=Lycorma delicatula TaxID=130591 RepID=UPI003F514F74